MASFGVNVDTTPMASKMESISQNVNLTTGAVVVMKESLLKVEAEATDFLCKNVNGGFYDLIISQISQKSALAQSETKAFALELVQQARELAHLKVRMSKDYAMITKRNISLFNSINKELENRITALDKEVIDFVKKEIKKAESRIVEHIASVPVNQSESLSVSQAIVAARIKAEADKLIEAMYRYLKMEKEQELSTRRIVHTQRLQKREEEHVPVLYCSTSAASNKADNVCVPEYLSSQVSRQVYEGARNAVGILEWQETDTETRNAVRQELDGIIEQSNVSARIAETMRKLFEKDQWKSLNK